MALQHFRIYFGRKDTHMEQLDNKPTCNKVLNCVVQTSAKGISSMRIHTMVALPWLCCVIQTGAKRWLSTGHLGWMLYWWMFLYYLNLPARRRFESLLVSDLVLQALGYLHRDQIYTHLNKFGDSALKYDSWSFWGSWKKFCKLGVSNYRKFENLWSRASGKNSSIPKCEIHFIK